MLALSNKSAKAMFCDNGGDRRDRPALNYFTVELTPLVDGTVFVSLSASALSGHGKFDTTIIDEEIVDTMGAAFQLVGDSLADYQRMKA